MRHFKSQLFNVLRAAQQKVMDTLNIVGDDLTTYANSRQNRHNLLTNILGGAIGGLVAGGILRSIEPRQEITPEDEAEVSAEVDAIIEEEEREYTNVCETTPLEINENLRLNVEQFEDLGRVALQNTPHSSVGRLVVESLRTYNLARIRMLAANIVLYASQLPQFQDYQNTLFWADIQFALGHGVPLPQLLQFLDNVDDLLIQSETNISPVNTSSSSRPANEGDGASTSTAHLNSNPTKPSDSSSNSNNSDDLPSTSTAHLHVTTYNPAPDFDDEERALQILELFYKEMQKQNKTNDKNDPKGKRPL